MLFSGKKGVQSLFFAVTYKTLLQAIFI